MEYVVQDEILSVVLLGREAENRVQLVLETALSPASWDEEFLFAPGGAKPPGCCAASVVPTLPPGVGKSPHNH